MGTDTLDWLLTHIEVWVGIAVPVALAWVARRIQKLDRKNDQQHADNADLLRHVAAEVSEIHPKVDGIVDEVADIRLWQAGHELEHARDTRA